MVNLFASLSVDNEDLGQEWPRAEAQRLSAAFACRAHAQSPHNLVFWLIHHTCFYSIVFVKKIQ